MKKLTKGLVRLYSAKDIRKRISDMGEEISDRYRNKNPIFIWNPLASFSSWNNYY